MSDDAPDIETPDLEAMAKRFLDLWQDQVAASVADPALAEWLARFLSGPGVAPHDGAPRHDPAAFADIFAAMSANSSLSPGTASAAASSGPRDDRVDELTRRLAACEERLAALESGVAKKGGKPGRKPSKRTA